MTKHLLIVEDEWIIYDDLENFLSEKGYSIAPYAKSYEEALKEIKLRLPDLVLLDINLQGERDGIELGDELQKTYKIPFIYLSAYSDELTLKRARRTNPETFLIKTKPQIDKHQLAVSIEMVLAKSAPPPEANKEGIFVYAEYLADARNAGSKDVLKKLLRFDDIIWIETDPHKRNYVLFNNGNEQTYFKSSLAKIKELVPFHFARINQHQIVNLKKVDGKINHSAFKIGDHDFRIGPNFSDEVHKVLHSMYVE